MNIHSIFLASLAALLLAFHPASASNVPCLATSHGCIWTNPDVRQATIAATICIRGYTKSVRPAASYTNGIKKKLMREQGIPLSRIHDYELDHIIPLALGGHPRNPSNLQLQPWNGQDGAKVKDKLEVRLQHAVCRGKMQLDVAQACIAENWISCAAKYPARSARRRY